MVFNFWHFWPKLGHLVSKWKKLLVFKKDRSAFDSYMNFGDKLGLRGVKYQKLSSPQSTVAKKW
jgi:hypothetical protein